MESFNAAQPDITLLLDRDGVIRQATLSQAVAGEQIGPWVGRRWADTVASSGSPQVDSLLASAAATGVSACGQVIQCFPSGLELPMEYSAVRLGPRGGVVAVGKSIEGILALQSRLVAARRERERDYWKLREVETRYRMLFDASADAVVLAAADTLRVLEANQAATGAFGCRAGDDFGAAFLPRDQQALHALLQRVQAQGRVPGILVHTLPSASAWVLRASLVRDDQGAAYLLQLAAVGSQAAPDAPTPVGTDPFVERLPDAFVILDRAGVVRRANSAFLDLAERGGEQAVIGQNLGDWLRAPGADLQTLLTSVKRHGAVRLFATTMVSDLGRESQVEISVADCEECDPSGFVMLLRDLGRFPTVPPRPPAAAVPANLLDHVGVVPLHTLVLEATRSVERACIEAALALSDGNRSAAAERLGISRQSLYLKLNRYDLGREGGGKEGVLF